MLSFCLASPRAQTASFFLQFPKLLSVDSHPEADISPDSAIPVRTESGRHHGTG